MEIFLKQGVAATIVFPLLTAASATRKSGATLAAGDFKICRHTGGAWDVSNPDTATPTEVGSTGLYALPLTATELTPDDQQYPIVLACHDVAGAEWDDQAIIMRVFDRDVEDLTFPAISGRSLDVDADGKVLLQPSQTGVTIPTVTTLTNAPTGMALEASVQAVKAKTDNLPASPAATGDIPTEVEVSAVVAADLASAHGAGAWGPSGAAGAHTVTITVTDGTDPLSQCLVTVKDATDTTQRDQARTNAAGQVVFSLDTATYKVHVGPLPGYQSLAAQTLVVDGAETVTYALTAIAVGAPSTPDLCRVYGYEYQDGDAVAGRTVTAKLQGLPQTTDTVILEGEAVTATTNASGYWYLDLVQGKRYQISIPEAGVLRTITIPDQATLDLHTLLN